jgi:hypothetical protein
MRNQESLPLSRGYFNPRVGAGGRLVFLDEPTQYEISVTLKFGERYRSWLICQSLTDFVE